MSASIPAKPVQLATMPLCGAHFKVLANGSMEQITGAALSTLAGIIIPMMKLLDDGRGMPSLEQGIVGAAGLTGIAVGAALTGRVTDRIGYAKFFRLCAVIVIVGSALPLLWPSTAVLVAALFMLGLGVGGGYVLDSDYISELMPDRWKSWMLGAAKASCALGFMGAAGIAWLILEHTPEAGRWPVLMYVTGALGVVTLLMRLRWPESPVWLVAHGRREEAAAALKRIFGKNSDIQLPPPAKKTAGVQVASWADMFKGEQLRKVIFTGIPWACEGVGVYGVGVFLPILLMALGLSHGQEHGMAGVIDSVKLTAVINFFILPGFIIGLMIVNRCYHVRMLSAGFWISAAGMAVLLAAYLLHWPVWVSVAAFILFEVALNGGPHLITFIIPAQVFSVANRGAGSGIAAMLGKVGAIGGVFFMPVLLDAGGVVLVLAVCIGVMVAGAVITDIIGPRVLPRKVS